MIRSKKQSGFTLVEIMIVVSIIILLAAIAIPSFIRARQRTQGSTTLNGARMLDGAVDQWAIENGLDNGAAITLASLSIYVKPGPMQTTLAGGAAPTDALNNVYVFATVGNGQLTVNAATKASLAGVVTDWGPY